MNTDEIIKAVNDRIDACMANIVNLLKDGMGPGDERSLQLAEKELSTLRWFQSLIFDHTPLNPAPPLCLSCGQSLDVEAIAADRDICWNCYASGQDKPHTGRERGGGL